LASRRYCSRNRSPAFDWSSLDAKKFVQFRLVVFAAVVIGYLHRVNAAIDVRQRQQAARHQDDEHKRV
jgi:hypothetical protein